MAEEIEPGHTRQSYTVLPTPVFVLMIGTPGLTPTIEGCFAGVEGAKAAASDYTRAQGLPILATWLAERSQTEPGGELIRGARFEAQVEEYHFQITEHRLRL